MKTPMILALAALTGLGTAAFAQGNGNGNGRPFTENGFCPPGLANKQPACIPPGQAAKYGLGDVIKEDYTRLTDPERYGLDVCIDLLSCGRGSL